jgi:hypothetical protein
MHNCSGSYVVTRTTLTLDDDVARLLDDAVHRERRPMKQVVNDALRRALTSPESRPEPYRLTRTNRHYGPDSIRPDSIDWPTNWRTRRSSASRGAHRDRPGRQPVALRGLVSGPLGSGWWSFMCRGCITGRHGDGPPPIRRVAQDAGPADTVCADLAHLEFLACGDPALTGRALRHSQLSAPHERRPTARPECGPARRQSRRFDTRTPAMTN